MREHGRRRGAARLVAGTFIAFLIGAFFSSPAFAHRTSLGAMELVPDGAVLKVALKLSAHDLVFALGEMVNAETPVPSGFFADKQEQLETYITRRFAVAALTATCPAGDFKSSPPNAEGTVEVNMSFDCHAPIAEFTLAYLLFFEFDPQHRVLGRFDNAGQIEEFVLGAELHELAFAVDAPKQDGWAPFLSLIRLGVEHIVFGFDHLLFLLALIMVPSRPGALVATVTGFTIAHSITLALAWFDIVDLPSRYVEAAIALSIAVVAAENVFRPHASRRWIVSSLFGLVHGLGFYGSLKALELGSAVDRLIGFNLGVELGQLAIIAIMIMPLAWWWRQSWYRRSAIVVSLLLIAIASVWTVERLSLT